jgi:hypothetical protein
MIILKDLIEREKILWQPHFLQKMTWVLLEFCIGENSLKEAFNLDFSLFEKLGTFVLNPTNFGEGQNIDFQFQAIMVECLNIGVPHIHLLHEVFHDDLDDVNGIIVESCYVPLFCPQH